MRKISISLVFSVLAASLFIATTGCSGGDKEAHDLPPEASKEKILAGKAERARPLLDALEKMKPEERQAAASTPRMAPRLKDGADDPDTKARMDRLGIHLH